MVLKQLANAFAIYRDRYFNHARLKVDSIRRNDDGPLSYLKVPNLTGIGVNGDISVTGISVDANIQHVNVGIVSNHICW